MNRQACTCTKHQHQALGVTQRQASSTKHQTSGINQRSCWRHMVPNLPRMNPCGMVKVFGSFVTIQNRRNNIQNKAKSGWASSCNNLVLRPSSATSGRCCFIQGRIFHPNTVVVAFANKLGPTIYIRLRFHSKFCFEYRNHMWYLLKLGLTNS